MKKLVSRKIVSILVVALFTISFAGVVLSEETQAVKEILVIKGTITSINHETAQVTVQDESGEIVTLAGLDVDLKDQNAGDQVIIEYDNNNIIKAIAKQKQSPQAH